MNKERIAKELVGYAANIFIMGLLSKGVQFIEQRGDRNQKIKEEKESRKWRVIEELVEQPDGTFEIEFAIEKVVTDEELQRWEEYSESYYAEQEGYYIARVKREVEKEKASKHIKNVANMAGKMAASVMADGVKRRIVYELKDSSRVQAKSCKDTELFLRNNIKNKLHHKNDMF